VVVSVLVLALSASAFPLLVGHTEIPNTRIDRARLPVAVAFFDVRRGLMTTEDGALLRTSDAGKSWRRVGRLAANQFDVLSPSVAYATTRRALLRTDDGGVHWRAVARVTGLLAFVASRRGWIDGRRVLATEDGGRTWRPLLRLPCESLPDGSRAVSRVSATLGFAACGDQPGAGEQLKRLYVTHDDGRSWHLRANERQMPVNGYLSSISFADARDGLLTSARGGLLATHNGGRTWRMLLLTDDATDVLSVQRLRPHALVVLLGDGALLRSSNGGVRWQVVYPHTLPRPQKVSFSTARDGIGAGYGDWTFSHEAILVTHDGGRSWHSRSRLPADDEPTELIRVSRTVLYVVAASYRGRGSVLFRSSNDGRTWNRVIAPVRSRFFGVSFTSSGEGVLGDSTGSFYVTQDRGGSWVRLRRRGRELLNFSFLTPSHAFGLPAQPGDTVLQETRDGGRSWHAYTRAHVRRPLAFVTLGRNRAWIVDMPTCPDPVVERQPNCPGAIVRTNDGGRTWQRVRLNMVPGSTSLDFVTPTVGYAQDPWSGLYRTGNGGRTWTLVRSTPTL